MRKLADSLLLASANLGVIGLVYLCKWLHVGNSEVGTILIYLLSLASSVLLLATAVYLPRDLFRRTKRLQAIVALLLSIPAVKFLTLLGPP